MVAAALASGLALTWAAHLVLLVLPASVLEEFLSGRISGWISVVVLAALLPQLYVVPWAWRDCGSTISSRTGRTLWRIGFLCAGFLAVTPYLFERWRCRKSLPNNESAPPGGASGRSLLSSPSGDGLPTPRNSDRLS